MRTTFIVVLAIFLACPVSLVSQEAQRKRPRESPPQTQPKEKPAPRPAAPRKAEGTKPAPSVPQQRPVPRKTDQDRDQETQRRKPPQRPIPSRSDGDQPSQREVPQDRPSPKQPAGERRTIQQDLIPPGQDARMHLRPEHRELFESVETAISRTSIRSLTAHLAPKVFISISGGESGHFSANQAQYVLENYFGIHRPIGFSFSTFGESFSSPYATGRGSFIYRGSRHDAQIYISLNQAGGRWVISQVNIY